MLYMITEKYRVDLGVVACDQPVFSRCSILAETAGDERKTSFAISFTGVRAFF